MANEQQTFVINEQNLKQLMQLTGQKLRPCQKKTYDVAACRLNPDVIFASRFEQPISYRAIKKVTHGKPFITQASVKKNAELRDILRKNGYYKTTEDNGAAVICSPCGDLHLVTATALEDGYAFPNDDIAVSTESLYARWNVLQAKGEDKPQAVGIQLPVKYLGVLQTKDGVLYANNPNVPGHASGDIIVIPCTANNTYDFDNMTVVNNAVFAQTYNQSIGGWGKSGLIGAVSDKATPTLEQLNKCIRRSSGVTFMGGSKKRAEDIMYACKFKVIGIVSIIIDYEDLGNPHRYPENEQEIGDLEGIEYGYDVIETDTIEDNWGVTDDTYIYATVPITGYVTIEVEARAASEAKRKASENFFHEANVGYTDVDKYELVEVKEL